MSQPNVPRARPLRPNRIADLLYLTLTLLVVAAGLEFWEFGISKAFIWGGAGATAATAVFPIAALPLYTRLALGTGPMLIQTVALAVIVNPIPALLPFFGLQTLAGSAAGGYYLNRPDRRGAVVTAGTLAGLASAAVFLLTGWWSLPGASVVAGSMGALLGGVLSGAIALALSPVAERVFGHVTALTLIEALNYRHPLLSRLVSTAPGTFLHSTNVSVLCNAGARAIGADELTSRVGALYHDVGKTRAPEDFIENQTSTAAYPDRPADDIREVLIDHVTDGVRLVLAHGLGERIADFVREHHGTTEMRSLIAKAERAGAPSNGQYRYPGPRPRSRETALLMLADRLEATARARRPETPDDCLALVREVVDQVVAEQQLVHSGLNDEDLDAVEQAYAEVLYAVHHHRVGYREPAHTPPRLRAVQGRQA